MDINILDLDTMEVKTPDGKSVMNIIALAQASFSKDGFVTTDYAQDSIVRGYGFQFKKRITLTALQTIYLEFDITKHAGAVFSLPINAHTGGGLVFLDTYLADSSTGGSTVTPLKLNGLSANVAKTTIKTGVSVSGIPINVREYLFGTASTNQSSGGGAANLDQPKILDNTKPLYFKIENKENAVTYLDMEFVWFELPGAL